MPPGVAERSPPHPTPEKTMPQSLESQTANWATLKTLNREHANTLVAYLNYSQQEKHHGIHR